MVWFVILVASVALGVMSIVAFVIADQNGKSIIPGLCSGILAIIVLGGGLAFAPQYSVWSEGLVGQAELARAEQNRQIRIQTSKALADSAQYEAEAEITRARGVAEANEIIADGLGGPEGYLRWRYIEMLQETGGKGRETIYIPTEAGMPILEAQRLK